MLGNNTTLSAQSDEDGGIESCGTLPLSEEEWNVNSMPSIYSFISQRGGGDHSIIPLYFTVYRNDDGSETWGTISPEPVTQELIGANLALGVLLMTKKG